MSKVKTTIVPESEVEIYDETTGQFVLNQPSKYFITLATGDLMFIHCRDRSKATEFVDQEFGKGFYTVKQSKQGSGSGEYTAVGVGTRARPASRPPK